LLLVFAPTLLWAIGATAIAFWLYGRATAVERGGGGGQQSPFDQIMDDGDVPGARTVGQVRLQKLPTTQKFATSPLPDHLKTKLGQPVQVGFLRVTPVKVSRARIKRHASRSGHSTKAEPCELDSLRLDLKLENLSTQYAFAPLDNYFDRQYTGRPITAAVPLTVLQAGDKNFFGGSHKWIPVARGQGQGGRGAAVAGRPPQSERPAEPRRDHDRLRVHGRHEREDGPLSAAAQARQAAGLHRPDAVARAGASRAGRAPRADVLRHGGHRRRVHRQGRHRPRPGAQQLARPRRDPAGHKRPASRRKPGKPG
jgi:hypothetical protein